ncbi:MAG: peptidylprolyl isomerase [Parvibaculum sp.]|uniref:peptidylprolyl isomerase n=1 Tax=Parvibaculum sp. TaxID=2024848 RepID=UPI0025D91EBD|nr:peptidylprolyl isomerase [Parvibaculum sp.]MCE9651091.1 peptidylprolyl isomerase [Parvibaculum sp.]
MFRRFAVRASAVLVALCLLSAYPAGSARADDDTDSAQGIAAVVNDQIVSRYDLEQRVKLIMVTSGIPNTPENKNRIESQVLRSLVDEALETQEAKRLEIKVEDDEVVKQLEGIAKRANMTMEQIETFLKENDVSETSLINQIKADLAWNKVVGQQFGPLVTVGEEEIDDVMKRLKDEADQPRYLVSEILLTFDTPAQEQEMVGGAHRLAEQIRQGAPFAAVAQQFSQSPSSANGGDIGWVHLSQLAREVAPVVEQMGIGATSEPIKTLNGVYIVQLRNKQTGIGSDPMQDQWTLARVVLPLSVDAPPALVERRAEEATRFAREFKSCADLPTQIKSYVGGMAETPRTVFFGKLDARMQQTLSKVKPGEVAPPIRSNQGVEMVAVCDHQVVSGEMPTRDAIEDNLYAQQLSMMARRHLRDLRRDAVIEIR